MQECLHHVQLLYLSYGVTTFTLRSCCRKLADAAKAAREAEKDAQMQLEIEAGQPGIFAFINSRLTGESEQNSGQAAASTSGSVTIFCFTTLRRHHFAWDSGFQYTCQSSTCK